jgi:hypothetical protein
MDCKAVQGKVSLVVGSRDAHHNQKTPMPERHKGVAAGHGEDNGPYRHWDDATGCFRNEDHERRFGQARVVAEKRCRLLDPDLVPPGQLQLPLLRFELHFLDLILQ